VEAPEIYGDPGLLLPQLDQGRFRRTGKHKLGIVPNLHDMQFVAQTGLRQRFPDLRIVDPRRAWNVVVRDILDHEFILASSLHGLVIADAYGIPCRYVRLTEKENILKYNDYYLGTGRMLEYASSIEQALDLGGAAALAYDPAPLISAFPYDIWGL
jgi:pyruvyltransferase